MTIEEIRKNAPDGAKHYSCDRGEYSYFYFDFQWFQWSEEEDCWLSLSFNPKKYRDIKPL